MDIPKLVLRNSSDKEVVKFVTDSLREINTNLQKAVVAENMGLVGQQQATLALVFGIMNQLDQKMNGDKGISTL